MKGKEKDVKENTAIYRDPCGCCRDKLSRPRHFQHTVHIAAGIGMDTDDVHSGTCCFCRQRGSAFQYVTVIVS